MNGDKAAARAERMVLLLYLLLSVGLLAPLASNRILPDAPDHANHTAAVVQARLALDEGQFPLRVAPWQHQGQRYPMFQFYSSTPYLLAGVLHKYITPANPWLALKLVYLAGLAMAAFFIFMTARLFGLSSLAAAVGGVVYITFPYLLVNIHARGAFTEAFAQFLVPVLSYLSFRLLNDRSPHLVAALACCWLVLATSHLITWLYTSFFLAVLVASLATLRRLHWKFPAFWGLGYALGLALAAFFLLPLTVMRQLQIHESLPNPYEFNWLTPISTLLSLTSAAPEPTPGMNTPFLHPNLGLPVMIGIVGCMYCLFSDRAFRRSRAGHEVLVLIILCALAFWCVWSPVDFWSIIPQPLRIAQFPYRFLTYLGLFGTLLFCWFLKQLEARYGAGASLVLLLAVLLAVGPYLPVLHRSFRTIESIKAAPDLGYGAGAYLYAVEAGPSGSSRRRELESQLPVVHGDGWLIMGREVRVAREYLKSLNGYLYLKGSTPANWKSSCRQLSVLVDGTVRESTDLPAGGFELQVQSIRLAEGAGTPEVSIAFASPCGFVHREEDPASTDGRKLWVLVESVRFVPGTADHFLGVEKLQRLCSLDRDELLCRLRAPERTALQLPVLYYPDLLRVSRNGQEVGYDRSPYRAWYLVTVESLKGSNDISVRFVGSRWGNRFSALAWLVVGGCFTWGWLQSWRSASGRLRRRGIKQANSD